MIEPVAGQHLLSVELRTGRLLIRQWREDDARQLLPILEANVDHFGAWIPARVSRRTRWRLRPPC